MNSPSKNQSSQNEVVITELDAEALEEVVGGGLSLGVTCTQYGSATFCSDSSTGEGDAVYL